MENITYFECNTGLDCSECPGCEVALDYRSVETIPTIVDQDSESFPSES